ncbi:hypothetical protein Tcan_16099 [Toxocara canis]|uniref:Uncharacterized protein n=1 Tax=Toxocara canis TaxID=6265 RepID=A0A0B2V0B7_TOXCA|nr:hypothetical protein Tcan_16099 [Toxocara canis]
MRSILACLVLVAFVTSKSVHKRNNEYGDEPLSPPAASQSSGGYGEQSAQEVPAPAEEAPSAVEQPVPAEAPAEVESSGYRKKRNNEYGDEPVAPQEAPAGGYGEQSAPEVPAPAEEAPSAVEQPVPAEAPAEVESSGYRKKRNNEYGDEPVAPQEAPAGGYGEQSAPEVPAPAEEAPSAVEQPVPAEAPAEVESSGYRKKRNNEYGDEPVAPQEAPAGGYGEQSAPEVPAPAEEAPSAVEQPVPAEAPAEVESSGYRKKRNNEYGDEPVAPQEAPAGGYGEQSAPEVPAPAEEAPSAVEQPVPAEAPAEVESSGYRKKRNNEYGDEPVAPQEAPAGGYGEQSAPEVPAPAEEAPSAVEQPVPAEAPAEVESSGYRKKRNNEYGDEPVAPQEAPAGGYGEQSAPEVPAPAEEAPSAVEQPVPAEAPAEVESSGYRKKRNNEYGDEPVAPQEAPAGGYGEQSAPEVPAPAEEAPSAVEQPVPAEAPAEVESSGYRKKRNNEYGDEPVAPQEAPAGGYGEQSAPEVPAPAEEAPSAVEQPVPAEAPAEVESSGYRKKRNNEYGDEPVAPQEAPAGGYGEQSAPEVPAPAEEAPSAVEQPVPAEAPAEVESSGYRKKRNNEYGDEPVAPQEAPAGGYGEQSAPEVPAPAEEAPSAVEQPVPAEAPAEVESSGYRKKRNNEYGDEPVAPQEAPAGGYGEQSAPEVPAPAEEAPSAVEQPVPAEAPAEVESSGYRKKRNNEYGDEPVAPQEAPAGGYGEQSAPEVPAPAEEAPSAVEQPVPAEAPAEVESSGYRKKRNNEYGDEPVAPQEAPAGGYGEQSAPEVPAPAEEAPSAVEQPVPAEAPAEVESSGYRKKRNNEYGDEPVAPQEAPAGGYGEQSAPEVPAPAEEAPSAVEQPVPAEAPAEVESSGYRKKRNNEYGDEPVAPQEAPAGGYGEQSAPEVPAPAEEAPSAVEQPVPAEAPAEVESSGYRKKRNNEYGDEPVAPQEAPAGGYGEQSAPEVPAPAEEAPSAVEQPVPAEAPAEVESSGYRKKRNNEYGDEPVAPQEAPAGGYGEQSAPEVPAPAEEAPSAVEQPVPAEAPAEVESSGYRKKRNNEYGDEPVAPQEAPAGGYGEQSAPEVPAPAEEAPSAVEQPVPAEAPAEVESSGYRKKRNNEYGDEPVAPQEAPAGGYGEQSAPEVPAPAEEAPSAVEQPVPAEAPAEVESSGYRKKRNNEYGDEPVAPQEAPAGGYGEQSAPEVPAPAEEAPSAVEQPVPAEAPAEVESSGYRKKRNNEYGDEPVAPQEAPAGGYGEQSAPEVPAPAEEAPSAVEQPVPAEAPAEVESSGYRKKRNNEYGDEPVAPQEAPAGGYGEQSAPEVPAPAEEAPSAVEQPVPAEAPAEVESSGYRKKRNNEYGDEPVAPQEAPAGGYGEQSAPEVPAPAEEAPSAVEQPVPAEAPAEVESSGYRKKRNNEYGDEPVAPQEAPAGGYGEQSAPEVPAPAEEAPSAVEQPVPAEAPAEVESSGYRKKRNNEYGDEPVAPQEAPAGGYGEQSAPEVPAPAEEAPSAVEQPVPAEAPAEVESSGYRKKRNNEYGDEPVAPQEAPAGGYGEQSAPEVPAPAEEAPSAVEQPVPAEAPAEVESSGYRKKRNNEYGDEPVAPQEAPAGGYGEQSAPEVPAPAEEAPSAVEQPVPAEAPAEVESSGYRKKRNNEYGDEPVAPQEAREQSAPEVPAPAEEAPSAVEQPVPAEAPAEVESSGYRKKRNNEYGDEPVPPAEAQASAGGYGEQSAPEVPAPAEEAPSAVEQPIPAEAPAEVESSGYRKKRNNEYGDEPVPPAEAQASAGGYGEQSAPEVPAPAEEAPSAVEQPIPAEAPAEVESSGYRKKRNNEYGDEPVPPAEAQASAGGYGEQSAPEVPAPAEEAPSAVEQPVPAEAPAEVESSGYRKKRNNEYGDEPVAPQQAPAGGYGEQSAPEVPAPAEEAPSAVEQPVPAEGPTAEVEASGY